MATRLRCVLTNAHTHTRTTLSLSACDPVDSTAHPFHITPSRLDTQALWWVACACFPLPETLSYIQSPRGPAGSPSPVTHTHTSTCWIGVTRVTHSIGGMRSLTNDVTTLMLDIAASPCLSPCLCWSLDCTCVRARACGRTVLSREMVVACVRTVECLGDVLSRMVMVVMCERG